MPLYIKDPRVSEMAERLRTLTNATSKTEAVLKALESAIEEAQRELWRRNGSERRLSPGRSVAMMMNSTRRPSATICGGFDVRRRVSHHRGSRRRAQRA